MTRLIRHLCLGATAALASLLPFHTSASPAEAAFASPPAANRILKIIHPWPDDPARQDQLIARLQTQGFGGVVCNVAFDKYLESDAKWQTFTRAVKQARQAGMAMWLYDEKGYPSANAGGLVLRGHPEWEAEGLLIADGQTSGQPITLPKPPGQLFLAAAFPIRDGIVNISEPTDLASTITADELKWQPPAGRWHVLLITCNRLYEGTHAELNLHEKLPYPNLLLPEPTRRFLELTHDRYAQHLGADLGKYFIATFTDEPSLMSLFLRPMPYRVLPWSAQLPSVFKQRHGYALEPIVPALILEAGPQGERHRYAYWDTIAELVATNFFGQIQNWCARHNFLSGGHLLAEEGIVSQVPLYGDFLRCARRLDAPSIDCLTSLPAQVPWHIARLISSVAELENKSIVMCETSDHSQRYRPKGDSRPPQAVSEAEIRGTANRLLVNGVNSITSYYSFADLSDDALRRLNEYIGRCSYLLTGGAQITEIALLYPTETVWTKFRPGRHWAQDAAAATEVENLCRTAADTLFANQRDFTFVDARALAEARPEFGSLKHRRCAWRAVILPGTDTLPQAAVENLARFVSQGGLVIALGALPQNSESEFPSPRVQTLAQQIFGLAPATLTIHTNVNGGAGIFLPTGTEALLPGVLNGLLAADFTATPPRSPVRVTHRRKENRDIYFVINDSGKPWQGRVTFAAQSPARVWNPLTGSHSLLQTNRGLPLELEPYSGRLFEFATSPAPAREPKPNFVAPTLTRQSLPRVTPELAKGEFVRAEVKLSAQPPPSPRWNFSATLTKSKVDTYLFGRWIYPQPLDLRTADFIVLDTWVPAGQATPSQLLLILHEKNGGDFLANTGRPLGKPGFHRAIVPLARLQQAGWSTDANGELDLSRVEEIRVGWGGYLGTEGERVEFSISMPETGAIRSAQ